jgi:hypothetical protein
MICNLALRMKTGTRCKPCHFSTSSGGRKGNPNYFNIGCTPKAIFKKYGIEKPNELGKPRLYYFLYNPQLNFQYPSIPEVDIFGIETGPTSQWLLHHVNKNNFDDSPWNLLLCLRNEHAYFEASDNIFYARMKRTVEMLLS